MESCRKLSQNNRQIFPLNKSSDTICVFDACIFELLCGEKYLYTQHSAKTQISLLFHVVWSVFALYPLGSKEAKISQGRQWTDQTVQMCGSSESSLVIHVINYIFSRCSSFGYFLTPDNQKNTDIFFVFLHVNIYCGYSLEVPLWGTSNEYHNIWFF